MKDCIYEEQSKCVYYQGRVSWRRVILLVLFASLLMYGMFVGGYYIGKHIGKNEMKSYCKHVVR